MTRLSSGAGSAGSLRVVADSERRARLARRHALAPAHRVDDPVGATEAVTVLHATEPATVHLSVQARSAGSTVGDVERALYDDRSLVKQLAMRRTLFVFPRGLLPAALGSASARVAEQQRRVIAKDVESHGVADDGAGWLDRARAAALDRLADGAALSARQLREELPELAGRTVAQPGKNYATAVPFAPRVLTLLGAEGRLVRGHNDGHWRTSRPTWTLMETWLGETPQRLTAEAGYAELVRHWLARFGPGTEDDLVWWLGATRSAVRRALADLDAVPVTLESGGRGWLLPDDVEPEPDLEPWAALLPTLDPTTMGWRHRDFYLEPRLTPLLFDTNGNAGTTAWWDGRIVGCWTQEPDGKVRVLAVDPLPAPAQEALEAEADRLATWLDGQVVTTIYKSSLMKQGLTTW